MNNSEEPKYRRKSLFTEMFVHFSSTVQMCVSNLRDSKISQEFLCDV